MINFEGMSKHEMDHLALEARVHFLEARLQAVHAILIRSLKDKGLLTIDGVQPEIYIEQYAERILQETLKGLADHDPAGANQIAAFLTDVKKDSQKDKP